MRIRPIAILALSAVLTTAHLAGPQPGLAQSHQMKDDLEQLAVDIHVGMDRSTLTEQQKAQLRDDFKELREAHQNHQMFAALRAARSIRTELDSGAFKPEDQKESSRTCRQFERRANISLEAECERTSSQRQKKTCP
jgi:Spy/CpxP family protein refolding chaperone